MTPAPAPAAALDVHVFGVGHGDCTLVEYLADGVVAFRMLCDGGTSLPGDLLTHLKTTPKAGTGPTIDVVVLSHVDNDHQGGLKALFSESTVAVGEYWGPCLPAFRRLAWLFPRRVMQAVENAEELEKQIFARGIPIRYPFEGHSAVYLPGRRVTVSVISPAKRLLQALLYGSPTALHRLLASNPLPLEWLVTGAALADEEQDETDPDPLGLTSTSPSEVALKAPRAVIVDRAAVLRDWIEQSAEAGVSAEPEFFGNGVLNDTSLVVSVDAVLNESRRRRVLLTGDQENWSHIAARHPAGLGVDVLKVPHHGGSVYFADKPKQNSVNELYLWLRPRAAIVSAKGHHQLPHVQFRDALRAAGSTLFCPNRRSFEPLTAGTTFVDSKSCFVSYACGTSGEQTKKLTLRLTGEAESASAPACVQGTLNATQAPIVVLQHRVVEPDQAFLRWTNTEVEKHATWLQSELVEYHRTFEVRLASSKTPLTAVLSHAGQTWGEMEARARAAGRHHLAVDPEPVLKYAMSTGLIAVDDLGLRWPERRHYRQLSSKEIEAALHWLRSRSSILFFVPALDEEVIDGCRWYELLQAAAQDFLTFALAWQARIPPTFVKSLLMPEAHRVLVGEYAARAARYTRGSKGGWLHLTKEKEWSVPDIFSASWRAGLWGKFDASEFRAQFLLEQNVALGSVDIKGYMAQSGYLGREADEDTFVRLFERAEWQELWRAA